MIAHDRLALLESLHVRCVLPMHLLLLFLKRTCAQYLRIVVVHDHVLPVCRLCGYQIPLTLLYSLLSRS